MRKLIIFFLLITNVSCKAQVVKQDLYIFMDTKPAIEVNDNTFIYQKFDIDFDSTCNNNLVSISVSDSGNLEKTLKVKATTNKIVSLIYKNKGSDNNPRRVNRDNIVNFLTHDEILCNIDIERFMKITSNFNVYIIQSEKNNETIFIAKRVLLERYSGM